MTTPERLPLAHLWMGVRFLAQLPSFLRRPQTLEQAEAALRRRLAGRSVQFLGMARSAIFDHPGSPWLALLRRAGCAYGDLEELVLRDGVEGALSRLFRAGVYLTVDEFKGRQAVVRGSTVVGFHPDSLRNPRAAFHFPGRSSASRGGGTPVLFDLDFVRGCGSDSLLALAARGGAAWHKATWEIPGAGARFRLLKYASFGAPPVRWFCQLEPRDPELDAIFRWSERALSWGSRLAGVPLPRPTLAPLEDPLPVARWMIETLRAGAIPHTMTFSSSAVYLSRAACAAGLDLGAAQITLAGEPITAARLAAIRRSGLTASPRYGAMECGPIGYGCSAPRAADDVHLLTDLHALIQPGRDGPSRGLTERALLITALHPAAPFVLLNVSMGDEAVMEERACGCGLEHRGWSTHLREIRSFEKLTSAGMTFSGSEVVRILEELLPVRFGGGPGDYQLVEEESEDGTPALRLLVHPRLGPLDESAAADCFLQAIGAGSPVEGAMELLWRRSGLLRVERLAPRATRTGKLLHLVRAVAPTDADRG